jgi:hypothetical protein
MRVYVRKWNGKTFEQEETVEMDAYDGLAFTQHEANVGYNGMRLERVTNVYMHASEPNALCVYVEAIKEEEE